MRRLSTLFGLVCALLVLSSAPVAAHTGLDSSTPAADATVTAPVGKLILRFTQPIALAGPGVDVLDRAGNPVAVDVTVDAARVTARPVNPLPAGRYGVRWRVRAGDAHPVDGSYTFRVKGPAGASSTDSQVSGPQAAKAANEGSAMTSAGTDTAASRGDTSAPSDRLDAALMADSVDGFRLVDQLLRAVFYTVALAAIGVLVFLLTAWEGTRREVRQLSRLTTRLAGTAAIVVAVQVFVRSARAAGSWSGMSGELASTLTGGYAAGVVMRIAGAVLLVAGVGALRRSLCAEIVPIAGGAVDVMTDRPPPVVAPVFSPVSRLWDARVAVIGALSLIGSFALIGHATAEPRGVAIFAVMAHTTTTALWGGGLLGLVVTMLARRRNQQPLRTGLVAARFSVLATVGVTLAALAGVALAVVRLEHIAELWTTAYGRVLLVKVAVVTVVSALGAYNHFVLVPSLRHDSSHHGAAAHLRRIGLLELGLLLLVAGLTSALVGVAG